MARYFEPNEEQEAIWRNWLAERPAKVRAVAELFDPWSLYRLKSTGQRVTVASFQEDMAGEVTVVVYITGDFNAMTFEREVYGIDPDDLEPCGLPDPAEPTGAAMTAQEVDENIDALRVLIRPDLWELGPDGKARRKDN